MDNNSEHSLNKRVEQLEQEVRALKELIEDLAGKESIVPGQIAPSEPEITKPESISDKETLPPPIEPVEQTTRSKVPPPPPPPPPRPTRKEAGYKKPSGSFDSISGSPRHTGVPGSTVKQSSAFTIPDHMKTGEFWLNKIGIGLLILSVIFLFKYSIDQGWLTPSVRIGLGLLLGVVLHLFAFKIYGKRRHFSLVLFGGGIATFYVCGFAAYQILQIVPFMTAMVFMCVVTLLAVGLSIRQDEQILSLLGAIGGFSTPFLLYTGQSNVPGLMTYVSILIVGMTIIYFFKRWRALLWITYVAAWLIIINVGNLYLIKEWDESFYPGIRAIQFGIIVLWLSSWWSVLLRDILAVSKPEKYRYARVAFIEKHFDRTFQNIISNHSYGIFISAAIISLFYSYSLWERTTTHELWGVVSLGAGILYGAVAYGLKRVPALQPMAYTHMMIGLAFATLSVPLFFDGHNILLVLSAEACLLFFVARYVKDKGLHIASHILYAIVGLLLATRLLDLPLSGTPIVNIEAMIDLFAIATIFLTASFSVKDDIRSLYFLFAFLALGQLINREFDNNIQYVLLATESFAVIYLAHRLNDRILRNASHFFYSIVAVLFLVRIFDLNFKLWPRGPEQTPILNWDSISDIYFFITLFGAQYVNKEKWAKTFYQVTIALFVSGLFCVEFENNSLFFALTAQIFLIQYLAHKFELLPLRYLGHLYVIGNSIWMFDRLLLDRIYDFPIQLGHAPIINLTTLLDILFLAVLFYSIRWFSKSEEKTGYRILIHLFVLAIFLREFQGIDNGQALVSTAWGVYGAVLLIVGLQWDILRLRRVAIITLLLVVGKLFVVDLANIDVIWRILLFFGFGAVFLFLSYYFKSLWNPQSAPDQPARANTESDSEQTN